MKLKTILTEEKIWLSQSAGMYVNIETGIVTISTPDTKIRLTKTLASKLCDILSDKLK